MGQSFYNKLLSFVFAENNISIENQNTNTRLKVSCLDIIQLLTTNLFLTTSVESAQDVTEYQFGFIIDSIAGELSEENKDDKMDTDKGTHKNIS